MLEWYSMTQLSHDQKLALKTLEEWYLDSSRKPFITLGGYAGTGKTTLVAHLRDDLEKQNKKLRVVFCSFTGKAVRVLENSLRNSGSLRPKDEIGTIHSLIYSPILDDSKQVIGWKSKDDLQADLIIVDEASMLDQSLWADLLNFRIPIIAIGDHGQLPPIQGKFNLMTNPDIKLEEIHRQAKDNPIIQLSIKIRNGENIEAKKYSDTVQKILRNSSESQEYIGEKLQSYDDETMVLCGYNSTRVKLNKTIRNILGKESAIPESGDKVICLKNDSQKQIYNGMVGKILKIYPEDKRSYFLEIAMDDDSKFKGLAASEQFGNLVNFNFSDQKHTFGDLDLFDYGYAITVHKAQGSQSRKVILFEERFPKMTDEEWFRWLYTGVTRAQEELLIVGN